MLSHDERLDVVGSAGSLTEARELLARWRPEVLVVDDQLPDGRGVDLAAVLRGGDHECAVVMISGADRPGAIDDAIEAGCSGFLNKGLGVEQLAEAVVAVAGGSSVFPASALQRRLEQPGRNAGVTEREVEVLRLLGSMYAPAEIGRELGISLHTVRNHIRSILSKLEARSQLEAVVLGLRHGLIDLAGPRSPSDRSAEGEA